jgi:hypothetical protein
MFPLSAVGWAAFWITLCPLSVEAATSARPTVLESKAFPETLLDEVRKTFTVGGKRIPPEIFRDFGDGDLADSGSIWVTVDVQAAVGSNLYADPIKDDGRWVTQTKLAEKTINGQEETSYQLIGATANNLLVLIATYNGGGSGTFYTLHILDVSGQRAFDMDGDVYQRINVTSVRNVALGDRWDGDVKISGNTILVTTIRDGPADTSGASKTTRIKATRP